MSENVWEAVGAKSDTLQEKLEQNGDVANTIMAVLGNLIVLAAQKGVPFEGISFGDIRLVGGEFSVPVRFSSLHVGTTADVTIRSDFLEYARARSGNMARALERSPRLHKFFENFVEALSNYALAKGIPFQALKVYKRIVTSDNVLVFQVGRETNGQ